MSGQPRTYPKPPFAFLCHFLPIGFIFLPAYAESHGCQPVDERKVGILRTLGEGSFASAGSGEVFKEARGVSPWSFTVADAQNHPLFHEDR